MELIDLRRGADGEGVPLRFAGCVIVLAMRMFFMRMAMRKIRIGK